MITPAQAGDVPPTPFDDRGSRTSPTPGASASIMDAVGGLPWVDDELWATVFEHAPVPLSLVAPDGRQLAGNAAYCAYLGYDQTELAGLDVAHTTREVDQPWTRAYLDRLSSGQLDHYTTEKIHVRKDGSAVRARLDITPIRRDGVCVALLGALTPVEEHRAMGEGLLRKLVENVHDTISLVDGNGRLLETSGRYRPIMGYPSEFWETRSIFDLLAPGEIDNVLALQAEVLEHPNEVVSGEFKVISADGSVETLEVHAVNLLDDPEVAGIVLTSRNITEHRRLIEDLRQSRDDAVAEAELRSRMLATVSHELRNPLHAVQGISELLAQSDLPEAERSLAGTVNRQVRDLTRVVDDLLTSSRLELDSVSLEMEPVDLRGLLTDVVAIARTTAVSGVDVNALIDPGMPAWIRTDPVRLRQVMSNLVGNAVKFTTVGRVRALAEVASGRRLVLEVSDTGAGIPADELQKIFEPFTSASTAGRSRGAGLGLSIVQRIVALLGGTVEVSSRVGLGSTFRITLPLDVVEPPELLAAAPAVEAPVMAERPEPVDQVVPAPSTAVARAESSIESRIEAPIESPIESPEVVGPSVLVIEDNAVNQQLARAQLRSMGYDCHVAGSGEEGLAYLETPLGFGVEVVLMDYHLPGIDGLETTRRIREREIDGRHVAVIGVTASASLADRESCLEAGMDDYVPKPVSLADLSAAFERMAAVRRIAREHPRSAPAPATPAVEPVEPAVEPVVEAPVAVAHLDLGVLNSLADELGDRTTVVDLIGTFLDELDARIDGIVAAREGGDGPGLRKLVHTITSSARLLGAGSLATSCAEFEHRRLDAATLRDAARSIRTQLVAWTA